MQQSISDAAQCKLVLASHLRRGAGALPSPSANPSVVSLQHVCSCPLLSPCLFLTQSQWESNPRSHEGRCSPSPSESQIQTANPFQDWLLTFSTLRSVQTPALGYHCGCCLLRGRSSLRLKLCPVLRAQLWSLSRVLGPRPVHCYCVSPRVPRGHLVSAESGCPPREPQTETGARRDNCFISFFALWSVFQTSL